MGVQGRPGGGGGSLVLSIKIRIIRISVSLLPDAHDLRAQCFAHTPVNFGGTVSCPHIPHEEPEAGRSQGVSPGASWAIEKQRQELRLFTEHLFCAKHSGSTR